MKAKGKTENANMQNICISILGAEESANLYYHLSKRNWSHGSCNKRILNYEIEHYNKFCLNPTPSKLVLWSRHSLVSLVLFFSFLQKLSYLWEALRNVEKKLTCRISILAFSTLAFSYIQIIDFWYIFLKMTQDNKLFNQEIHQGLPLRA